MPGGLKNTYPGTSVSQAFPNGCLAVNSSRSYLAGGMIPAMYSSPGLSIYQYLKIEGGWNIGITVIY